ncbi:MAG: thioesterase [Saprospiraceae bacterium]|nr:thioesterase [Saprospiraceae bacterium]MDZ4705114.1 thioesterase [Saprospiraceae bacterium]
MQHIPHQPISPLAYSETFVVRTYEIDHCKRATIPALIRLMQEAAMQNVIQLNVSVWDLEAQNISWVLLRKSMQVFRLPGLGEQIRVLTCPTGFDRRFTYRDYKIFGADEELLLQSSSAWLLMDMVSRRMAPIPPFILEFESKMPAPEDCLPRPDFRFPKFEQVHFTKIFEVNFHDLDFNLHLNNTLYIQWMLEAMPHGMLQHKRMASMEVLYRAESRWDDVLYAETQVLDDHTFLHRLMKKGEEKELAMALSRWV